MGLAQAARSTLMGRIRHHDRRMTPHPNYRPCILPAHDPYALQPVRSTRECALKICGLLACLWAVCLSDV
jgi:hypothetical protein